jgi:hypothetical protein
MLRPLKHFGRIAFVTLLFAVMGCSTEPAQTGSIRLQFSVKLAPEGVLKDSLFPVSPNPFNRVGGDTALLIQFTLQDTSAANLLIQNALGDPIANFYDTLLPPGTYSGWWDPFASDGTPLMSGIYFVTIQDGGFINSRLVNLQENE